MNRNSAWTSLFLYNDGTLYNERLAMNSLRMRQSELIPCKTCKAEILNWSQLPCGTKFLRVLIFQPAIRKKKAPQKEDKLPQIFLHLYSKYTNTCKKSFLFLFVIVWRRKVMNIFYWFYTRYAHCSTVEPRFNEVPRDWGNLFVISNTSI